MARKHRTRMTTDARRSYPDTQSLRRGDLYHLSRADRGYVRRAKCGAGHPGTGRLVATVGDHAAECESCHALYGATACLTRTAGVLRAR